MSRAAREALVLAEGKADKLGHRYIRNEHLLLGLVESESNYAAQLLRQKDISAEKLRLQIKALPQTKEVHEPTRKSKQSQAEGELIRRVGERVGRGEGQSALQVLEDYMAEPGQDRKLRMRSLATLQVSRLYAL